MLDRLSVIYRITKDEKYGKFADQLEAFLVRDVEGKLAHPRTRGPVARRLRSRQRLARRGVLAGKVHRTKDKDCLRRAEADAWLAFLMLCPKQLSWVRNPTQTCHTEQQHYLQYSNYCYNNRKYYCLDRLSKLTGQKLFGELCERIIQCGFWAQPTSGDWIGGMNERMSDPWKAFPTTSIPRPRCTPASWRRMPPSNCWRWGLPNHRGIRSRISQPFS